MNIANQTFIWILKYTNRPKLSTLFPPRKVDDFFAERNGITCCAQHILTAYFHSLHPCKAGITFSFWLFSFQTKRDKYHKKTGPAWRVGRGMVPHTALSQHTTGPVCLPDTSHTRYRVFCPPHRYRARAALKGCWVCTRSSGPLIPLLTNICVLLCRMWDFYHISIYIGYLWKHRPTLSTPCYDPP